MIDTSNPQHLLCQTDVALLLGVVPSAVSNWQKRGSGPLPEPTYVTRGRPYWTIEQIAPLAAEALADAKMKVRRLEQAARIILEEEK